MRLPTDRTCGPFLDDCRAAHPRGECHPGVRTAHEVAVAHRAAVARARRSGFARQPLPQWLVEFLDPRALRDARERVA